MDATIRAEPDYRDQALLQYSLRRCQRISEDVARAAGITPQQHLLLLSIRGHPAYPQVTVGQIAERLLIRRHSASLLVDRGVKRGLLTRRDALDDRRKVLVSLSPEGARILEQIALACQDEVRVALATVIHLGDS